MRRTDADGSKQADCGVRLFTRRKQRLNDVVGKRQCDDRYDARPDNHAFNPQPQECQERTERLVYVGVVGPGPDDQRAQFSVAVGADHREETAAEPDQQRQTDGVDLLHQHNCL